MEMLRDGEERPSFSSWVVCVVNICKPSVERGGSFAGEEMAVEKELNRLSE